MSIPTTQGPYWWRAKDGCAWDLVYVREVPDCGLIALWPETGLEIELADMRGQWAKVHKPDDVATLRAKAEAYDNGMERLAVYNGKGHFMWTDNYTTTNEQAGLPVGCQLRKVRVCEEVEQPNEKGER